MKIAIITQPLWGNTGGILQNLALQQVLKGLGHYPITLDYMWNLKWYKYLLVVIKTCLLYCFPRYRNRFPVWKPVRKEGPKDTFIKDYINKTDEYVYTYNQKILDRYGINAVISGSDQVWRPRYNPELQNMYLGFVDNKLLKLTYGASFGTNEIEYTRRQIKKCSKAVNNLNSVSVRENSGIYLCKEYYNIEAKQVLDPTLLLDRAYYESLISDITSEGNGFIGCYLLDDNSLYEKYKLSASNIFNLGNKEIKTNDDVSPLVWISMFRDANFIVTDSFHGTVFALIFNKPFITICNGSRGKDRLYSLLSPLNLENRIVDEYDESLFFSEIDWDRVNALLYDLRVVSIDFLTKSLSL